MRLKKNFAYFKYQNTLYELKKMQYELKKMHELKKLYELNKMQKAPKS